MPSIKKLIVETEKMKGMIRTNTVYLKKLVDKRPTEEIESAEMFSLPLKTEVDVQEIERQLEDKKNTKSLVSNIYLKES